MKKALLSSVHTLTLGILLVALSACESTDPSSTSSNRESTLPWNRPANWEGGGVLGSMMGNR